MSNRLQRAVMALSIAAFALAFAGPVRAEEEKVEKVKKRQFTGVIESASGDTVVVKKGDESKSFKVGEKTKYRTADKDDSTMADLKVGDKYTVNYTEEDGTLVAHKIAPPERKKKETEKTE